MTRNFLLSFFLFFISISQSFAFANHINIGYYNVVNLGNTNLVNLEKLKLEDVSNVKALPFNSNRKNHKTVLLTKAEEVNDDDLIPVKKNCEVNKYFFSTFYTQKRGILSQSSQNSHVYNRYIPYKTPPNYLIFCTFRI